MSEYRRGVILEKPVKITYQNKSIDEVLEDLVLLRKELNAIGNNVNQAVHHINSAPGTTDTRLWVNLLGIINSKLEPSIIQFKDRMNEFADIWPRNLLTVNVSNDQDDNARLGRQILYSAR